MNKDQADIIAKMLETALELAGWHRVRASLLDFGYEPHQIVDACEALGVLSQVEPAICREDFEE